MAKYYSTKTYGNDRGLSCCFRQWRAKHSHCSLLHGYSIGIKLIFESDILDCRNWVMDFGGLKKFKEWSEYMFDHTLLLAIDDPNFDSIMKLSNTNGGSSLAEVRVVSATGCESFAKMAYDEMTSIIDDMRIGDKITNSTTPINANIRLTSVEVFEHGANSAIYEG